MARRWHSSLRSRPYDELTEAEQARRDEWDRRAEERAEVRAVEKRKIMNDLFDALRDYYDALRESCGPEVTFTANELDLYQPPDVFFVLRKFLHPRFLKRNGYAHDGFSGRQIGQTLRRMRNKERNGYRLVRLERTSEGYLWRFEKIAAKPRDH